MCVRVVRKYPASVLWIPGSVEFLPVRRAGSRSYLLAFRSLTRVCFPPAPPLPPGRSEKWHKSFLTFPLQRETKATPLKLRGKYECHSGTKQSYNFLPPTISPCIIKSEKQKPQTHFEEGHLFSLPPFLSFLLARKKDGSTLHTKTIIHGDIFIDRNNTYHTVCVPLSFRSIYSGSQGRQLGPIHPRSGLGFLTSPAEPGWGGCVGGSEDGWAAPGGPQRARFPGGACCLCAVPQ